MPVPPEEFVGRHAIIDRIQQRGLKQVSSGRSYCFFLEGESGFGKTSLAQYIMKLGSLKKVEGMDSGYGLLPLYVSVGGCETREDFAEFVLRAAASLSGTWDALRNFLSKFVSSLTLFGVVEVNTSAIRESAPDLATPDALLGFLANLRRNTGTNGVILVLDEINGIANTTWFPQFMKSLVDVNAVNSHVPLLLIFCGIPERRQQMIQNHKPVERIWDPIQVDAVNVKDIESYLVKAFSSVRIEVTKEALDLMTFYSGGHPRIMHIIGDVAFWQDSDEYIDEDDTERALEGAADEVGAKFVDRQVIDELHSTTYKRILKIVGQRILENGFGFGFTRKDVLQQLRDPALERNLDNFLQRLRNLGAIDSNGRGAYKFSLPIIEAYIAILSARSD